MGRPVKSEFSSGRVGVGKVAQRQRCYLLHVIVAEVADNLLKQVTRRTLDQSMVTATTNTAQANAG